LSKFAFGEIIAGAKPPMPEKLAAPGQFEWTKDVSVIITIVGWLALIKGIVILIQPKIMIMLAKAMAKKESILRIEAIAVIILGLVFSFLGFCPKSPI